jgi:mono/diheme cytochrome c family protein
MAAGRGYLCAALCGIAVLSAASARAAADPAAVFAKKCSACHTYGKGDRVGPDLKGVTTRRDRAWLSSWIRSSQQMIASGDPTATALYDKYKHERMPDQGFPPEDIAALIDYLAAGGPAAADATRPRHARDATAADIALGRQLFLGTVAPKSGGASCGSCHVVRENGAPSGGTFASELTHVYSRFQDVALSAFLLRPCFPRTFDGSAVLTASEAFAVKAFLRYVDRSASRPSARQK